MGRYIHYPKTLSCLLMLVAVNSASKRYQMDINEMGWDFTENIELDEDTNTVKIQVPHHNEVAATNFVHDFNRNLTLRYLPEIGECYLTDLSRLRDRGYLTPPRRMKQILKKAQSHKSSKRTEGPEVPGVEMVQQNWVIGGQLGEEEVAGLSASMREVCPHTRIHRLVPLPDTASVHTEQQEPEDQVKSLETSRPRRQITTSCVSMGRRCKRKINSCAYIYYQNCDASQYRGTVRTYASCKDENTLHIIDAVLCCRECCLREDEADDFLRYCNTMGEFSCTDPFSG